MERILTRTLTAAVVVTCPLFAADPDPAAEKYARAVKAEDEVSRKLAERVAKPGDSERERWFKRLDEVYTGRVPTNPADWFDLITAGKGEWSRDTSRYFAEFHERVCYRLDLKKDTAIGRDLFAGYAANFLGENSPPWKVIDFADESRGLFKQLDANRDGFLGKEECSPGLQERFEQADTDKDGKIGPSEFRDYLIARVKYESQFAPQPEEKGKGDRPKEEPAKPATDNPEEPKAVVYHDAKNLPKELPGWWRELDTDKDLQIGLYEWVAAKRSIAEFKAMDLNGDGILEVAEYLRYRKLANDGSLPKLDDLRAAAPGEKEKKK